MARSWPRSSAAWMWWSARPGRVIDHLKRGTLRLDSLEWLVLDEADEMLRMGFIDDVEWVFENTPPERKVALFSATMPSAIRRIAKTHLRDPQEVTIKTRTTTADNIRQRYWIVGGGISKLEALTRLLEAEPFDAMLVFARTKKATDELAEKISARGYACASLNGDIVQAQRERTIAQLKNKQLDIIVATDVAARGLDVDRISHVINFDIPHDTESYVHRIGRTGRAGRQGDAILFVTMREKRLFKNIERATRQAIEPMDVPSMADVNAQRVERFKQSITDTLEAGGSAAVRGTGGNLSRRAQRRSDATRGRAGANRPGRRAARAGYRPGRQVGRPGLPRNNRRQRQAGPQEKTGSRRAEPGNVSNRSRP